MRDHSEPSSVKDTFYSGVSANLLVKVKSLVTVKKRHYPACGNRCVMCLLWLWRSSVKSEMVMTLWDNLRKDDIFFNYIIGNITPSWYRSVYSNRSLQLQLHAIQRCCKIQFHIAEDIICWIYRLCRQGAWKSHYCYHSPFKAAPHPSD